MPGMFDGWDERRARAERPAAGPTQPVDPGRASAYALAALQGEVQNIQAVPVGEGRNDQLNRSALKMYGLAEAGAISHQLVTEVLGAADGGLDYPATEKTLRSAREAAARYGARVIPLPTAPSREVTPWEASDDPFSEHYVAPAAVTPAATSGRGDTSSATAPTAGGEATRTGSTSDPLVAVEVAKLRLRRDAKRLLDHEDAAAEFRIPPHLPTLKDELELPVEPTTYLVGEVIPTGANVLLTAQYKTGKTTLVNNLTRSLVDAVPFLGRYDVAHLDGRVALFNYEVDDRQYRRWLRDAGIDNPDRVALLNLRGYRLPLSAPFVEDWVVEYLKSVDAAVWVVDPFARAAVGSVLSENDNGEVGRFLDTLDVIKDRAGVGELVLPVHTGRAVFDEGEERARGATRLDDWADVRWLLTKDKADVRYFRATGRDVDTDEAALAFEPATRELTLTDGSRRDKADEALRNAVETMVREFPGIGVVDLRAKVRDALRTADTNKVERAVGYLITAGRIHRKRSGHTLGHHPGRDPDTVFPPDIHPTPDPFA